MKIAILCLCLLTITFAVPVRKPRHHDDGSMSAEGRHDSREHRHHGHKHHHHHSHSQENVHSHESQEQHVSSQLSALSSEESEEITEQQTLLVPAAASKSLEDSDNHSDVDDDDDDHSDSDDSDDSHEGIVTDFPTESPFSTPVPPDTFTGRGDSAPYLRADIELVHFKKSHKKSGKFDSHDVTDDFDSTPDVDSHETYSSKARSLESHDTSVERDHVSDLRDSNEVHSTSHDRSLEKVSRQSLESVEDDHDDGDHDNSKIAASLESHESVELQKDYHDGLQQVAHDHSVDDVSNQTLESAEDHHSVEDHPSVEDHHSVEEHHSVENHSVENYSTEDHHSVEDHHSIENNEVIL